MRCRTIRRLLPGCTDGALTPAEGRAVEAHLAGCAACQAEAEALRESARALHAARAAPDVDLWASVSARLTAANDGQECARVAAQLPAFLDGDTAPAAGAALERHLAACRACAAERDAQQRALVALRAAARLPERPPRDLWPAVREQVARRAARRRAWQLIWQPAAAGILAAALLAGGWFASGGRAPEPPAVAQLEAPRPPEKPPPAPAADPLGLPPAGPAGDRFAGAEPLPARPVERAGAADDWTAPAPAQAAALEFVLVAPETPLEQDEAAFVRNALLAGSEIVLTWREDADNLGSFLLPIIDPGETVP